MSKRIINLSNLIESIKNKTITIEKVICQSMADTKRTETDDIDSEAFVEALEFLNESTLFKDAVDFYYEFNGKKQLIVRCGFKNPYMTECYTVNCSIKDGVSYKEIDTKFRENILDKVA